MSGERVFRFVEAVDLATLEPRLSAAGFQLVNVIAAGPEYARQLLYSGRSEFIYVVDDERLRPISAVSIGEPAALVLRGLCAELGGAEHDAADPALNMKVRSAEELTDVNAAAKLPLPERPRLADHAALRRHRVARRELGLVHDSRSEEAVELTPLALRLLELADGTRDLEGILLAAKARGLDAEREYLASLLALLHSRGLLAGGVRRPAPPDPLPDRPLEVLPNFALSCDQSGACCGVYGSILFSRLEARRALRLVPDVLGRDTEFSHCFSPLAANRHELSTVTLVDGACAFLSAGRCSVEIAGGSDAKPRGCRSYPAVFVDDTTRVRVTVAPECPCVFSSIGAAEGSPLVPAHIKSASGLPAGTPIKALPELVTLSGERRLPLVEFASLCDRLRAQLSPDLDVPRAVWNAAEALKAGEAATFTGALTQPSPAEVRPWLESLGSSVAEMASSARAWRAERDRARLLALWLEATLEELAQETRLASVLNGGEQRPREESFVLDSALFGRTLVLGDPSLEIGLRRLALSIWCSRGMATCARARADADPHARHPLAAVLALLRGRTLAVPS